MTKSEIHDWLEKEGSSRVADGLARYGIETRLRVYGVSMGTLQMLARQLKKDLNAAERHKLAAALWTSGAYEARLLAAQIDDPSRVTPAQMDRWVKQFENWADCDTVCFKLFDQTPHAFAKAKEWAKSPREFVRRAGFALMASLALHDKTAPDKDFMRFLPLIEKGASDERNFVKKGVSWALRSIGRRRPTLHDDAVKLADRLAMSSSPAARWIGKDALRDLSRMRAKPSAIGKKG